MGDDSSVSTLIARVCDGDQEAWNKIIERYAPVVWSVCQRYQLSRQETDDVGQLVWLSLVENVGSFADETFLPLWLAKRTRIQILNFLRAARVRGTGEQSGISNGQGAVATQKALPERIATLACSQALMIVVIWVILLSLPVFEQTLPAKSQEILNGEIATIGLALAVTTVVMQNHR
jgi:RNA polymerase sigma factor (sigma-70 family)